MKKFKTSDGYNVYRIKKEKEFLFLADQLDYKKEITKLLDTFDDLKFDSVIFLFGIDTGEYINELKKSLCVKNKVIIFEPNHAIYKKYDPDISDNIKLVFFEDDKVRKIFDDMINFKNTNNVYFYAFGDYSRVYKNEYDRLIEYLDWALINAGSQIGLAKRFKKVFVQNMIANMKVLNQCTPIHRYMFTNVNVPAIVVSGGPSLDLNIKEMLKYKNKLKKCFIITGSRTVGALIENDIMPDMIVSVDPVDANYDMMKNYLDLKVPIAFYEYSNRYLVRDYKGDKIIISILFSQMIKSLQNLRGVYCGGSVAHACIDIANMLGCSPIIFVGQDLAYTYNKHHADSATIDYDKDLHYRPQIIINDIYGTKIGSTITLDYYRKKLEHYIDIYNKQKRIKFINCSYGAEIKGAPHEELSEVFEHLNFNKTKKSCIPIHEIKIDSKEILISILDFIDECLNKSDQGLELCEIIISENHHKSLMEMDETDIDLQRVLYIVQIVNEFENALKSQYLGGYFTDFLYEMKEGTFLMFAKDYEKLTSDLQHQASVFKMYFEKMNEMLTVVKKLAMETVSEFYESHIIS